MNEVATRNENLPMDATASGADYLKEYGEQASMRSIVGKLLKFSKGDYMAGEGDDDIPVGTEMIVNIPSLTVGWIRWADNKPTEQIMGVVFEGYKPPKRTTLGDDDKSLWEVDDVTHQPRDPWQLTNYLIMKMPDSEQLYTFTTSSRGGIQAVGELMKVVAPRLRMQPKTMPIITLGVDFYVHDKYGRIKVPLFVPVRKWGDISQFDDAQGEMDMAETVDPKTGEVTGGEVKTAGQAALDATKDVRASKPRPGTKF